MPYRYHGHASVDPSDPRAWAVCDRCGFLHNRVNLSWQFDFAGPTMINHQLLVCDKCHDKPAGFMRTITLPPDPIPVTNIRNEPYEIDETSWLVTEGGSIIDGEDEDNFIT